MGRREPDLCIQYRTGLEIYGDFLFGARRRLLTILSFSQLG